MTVHVLLAGLPLCGFSTTTPDRWPPDHVWVSLQSAMDPAILKVTCADCAAILSRQLREG